MHEFELYDKDNQRVATYSGRFMQVSGCFIEIIGANNTVAIIYLQEGSRIVKKPE